jgi:ABC-type antimicrobial peptide transport system permease subunit
VDIAAIVRRAAAGLDSGLAITREAALDEVVDRHLGPQRIFAWASALLAGLGFVLASVGIYGLVSQSAAERTREFGIRLALGAERGQIAWLVVRSTLVVIAIGAPLGVAMAAGLSHLVASQLFGITPTAPGVYAAAVAGLGTVVIVSGAIPAWIASRSNPADVMRVE